MSVTFSAPLKVSTDGYSSDGAYLKQATTQAVIAAQTFGANTTGSNITVNFQIPAGSAIVDFYATYSAGGTNQIGGGTITATLGGAQFATGTLPTVLVNTSNEVVFTPNVTGGAAQTAGALWVNTGNTVKTLSLSTGPASGGYLQVTVSYIVRNADGSITSSGSGQ